MGKKLQILVFEDDHLQARDLRNELEGEFGADVRLISTEYEFRRALPEILNDSPDVVVLDRVVRWANPARDMPSPPQPDWDPEQAGLRCAELIEANREGRTIAILLFSVIGDDGDVGGFECITKESEFDNLISRIQQILQPD